MVFLAPLAKLILTHHDTRYEKRLWTHESRLLAIEAAYEKQNINVIEAVCKDYVEFAWSRFCWEKVEIQGT